MTINKYRTLGYTPSGSVKNHWNSSTYTRYGGMAIREWLQTTYSPGPPFTQENNFRVILDRHSPLRASGKGLRYQWNDFPDHYYSNWGSSVFPQGYYEPNYEDLTNEALKISNPNKPVLDVPLFLYELKDIPQLIQDFGIRSLYGRDNPGRIINPGKRHLSEQFGWKPLISDLRTLLDLTDQIDSRLQQLRDRSKSKSISGNLPSRQDSSVDPTPRNHAYSNTYIWYKRHYEYKEENWFTTRFEVDQDDLLLLDRGKKEQLRWALGLNASLSTMWNMIPWSWLIDYFATVGDYLAARRGGIRWKASNMCIMSTTTYRRDDRHYSTNGWGGPYSIEDGYSIRVMKRRKVVPLPKSSVVFFPFLTDGMKTNLGALALSFLSDDQATIRIARR